MNTEFGDKTDLSGRSFTQETDLFGGEEHYDPGYDSRQEAALQKLELIPFPGIGKEDGKEWQGREITNLKGEQLLVFYSLKEDKTQFGTEIEKYYICDSDLKYAIPLHRLWEEDPDVHVFQGNTSGTYMIRKDGKNNIVLSRGDGNLLKRISKIQEERPGNRESKREKARLLTSYLSVIGPIHEFAHHLQISPNSPISTESSLITILTHKLLSNETFVHLASKVYPGLKEKINELRKIQAEIERNAEAFTLMALRILGGSEIDIIEFFGGVEQIIELTQLRLELAGSESATGGFPFTDQERREIRQL
jgi:hypothetical protein